MTTNWEKETRLKSEQVTLLEKTTGKTSGRLSDNLVAEFGTSRRRDVMGVIGEDGKPYEALLNNYIDVGAPVAYIKGLSGLVAYYPLDETSGDAINQAPDTLGTLNGTVTGATQGVSGQIGKAYSFDGSNDDVVVDDINEVNNLNTMTMFGIVKANATPSTKGFFGFRNTDVDDAFYILGLGDTTVEYRFRNSAGDAFTINATVTDVTTDWFLYTIVLDEDTLTCYQNGDVVGTPNTSVTGSFGTAEHDFYIARDDDTGRRLNGLIQHVGILNRAMTASEVAELAQLFF